MLPRRPLVDTGLANSAAMALTGAACDVPGGGTVGELLRDDQVAVQQVERSALEDHIARCYEQTQHSCRSTLRRGNPPAE